MFMRRVEMEGYGRTYEPALRRAEILNANFHILRHTTASRPVACGLSLLAVKESLGHRRIQTTLAVRISPLPTYPKPSMLRACVKP